MIKIKFRLSSISIKISKPLIQKTRNILKHHLFHIVFVITLLISSTSWLYYSSNGLHLAYNDAMSHLAISRRVVDNITPGAAQLGSVWLPLLHVLMLPTIWIDSFWHSGFSAALISTTSFILTTLFVYKTVMALNHNRLGALLAAFVVATNANFLYLQTTALTEPLFMALFTISMYLLIQWEKTEKITELIGAAFFIMLLTLTRYDGWAVLIISVLAIFLSTWKKNRTFAQAMGIAVLFSTLAGLGIVLWLLWNQAIFGSALYFVSGEFSAKAQQVILATVKDLPTKGNLLISIVAYYFSTIFNIGIFTLILGVISWIFYMKKTSNLFMKLLGITFLSPLIFNIAALYLGHSVIHLPGIIGDTWFNIRYGLIMLPTTAVFIGYLMNHKHFLTRTAVPFIIILQTLIFHSSGYLVTLEDGLWGSSKKNVKGIGNWANENIESDGLILASVSSHDATLFSTGFPMKRFIHEGTGKLWRDSLKYPDRHAKYILMRTYDTSDSVTKAMTQVPNFAENYELIYDDEFADIYSLKENISTQPVNNTIWE